LQVTDNYSLNNRRTRRFRPAAHHHRQPEQFTDLVTNELRQAAGVIRDVFQKQARTKEETGDLPRTPRRSPPRPADKAVSERLGNQQSTSASQANQVAGKLEAVVEKMNENKSPANDLKQLAGDVKDLRNNTAENPMKEASAKITQASQQKDAKQRDSTFKGATDNQQHALDQLQTAMDRMGSVGSLMQTIDRIKALLAEQLAHQQGDIGSRAEPWQDARSDDSRIEKLDKAAKDQRTSAKTDKTLQELSKLAEQMKKQTRPRPMRW
jgi:hypothetical protein